MAELPATREAACFFEVDGTLHVLRRSFVEAVGACLLTVAMVGSGLAVEQKLAGEPIAASLVIAISIAGSLVGLIIALGKVSGGHYNPLITIGQWLRGERSTVCTICYVVAQVVGGIVGSTIATTMFGTTAAHIADGVPSFGLITSEFVAATGLLIIVIGCGRSSRWDTGPFAVGAWLTAAILATPSTSYANPAVTIAAVFAGGPVALTVVSAVTFVAAQIVGLLAAIVITKVAFEQDKRNAVKVVATGG
ncbi:aquaporin [Rhizobiaceae bacterium n13]|uniref:Aquaporin n=1 Tax=Ferirhizobium litorale TaxID=2927786 RepID=A0AAE3Q8Y4_9HYPH|nr:aquaporin [Fererhizobium litorale]MDI7860335.1 aquaporin [Fererhizobium litorale]MDI7920470.1 aquaporin [Fererhizobium litorale]